MTAKAEAVARLPLPGAHEANGPFAAMSRAELEDAAAFLASVVCVLLTPPLTPLRDTAGDSPRPTGPTKRRKAAA